MKNIRKFTNPEELKKYLKSLAVYKIGIGSEGNAYLTHDNEVLKVNLNNLLIHDYNEDIITTDMIDLESFLFPNELILYNDRVIAYKTKLFKGDIFYNNKMRYIAVLDLNKLLKAREKMINDIINLSSYNYLIMDLPYNLLCDGKKLAACDTLSYLKKEKSLKANLESLDYAIDIKLSEIDPTYNYFIDETSNTEKAIKKLIKEKETNKVLVFPSEF